MLPITRHNIFVAWIVSWLILALVVWAVCNMAIAPAGKRSVAFFSVASAVIVGNISVRMLRRQRLEERYAAGQCLACGYDLRASQVRCPECGAAIVPLEPPDWGPGAKSQDPAPQHRP